MGIINCVFYLINTTSVYSQINFNPSTAMSVDPQLPGTSFTCTFDISLSGQSSASVSYSIIADGDFISSITPASPISLTESSTKQVKVIGTYPTNHTSTLIDFKYYNTSVDDNITSEYTLIFPAYIYSPSNLTATNITSSGCTLSWTASSSSVSGYKVYQNGVYLKTVLSLSTTVSLSSGTSYSFYVTASDGIDDSYASNSISVLTKPAVPASLSSSSITSIGCVLNWSTSFGATGYYVYQNGVKINPTITVSGSTASATISGLSTASTYNYYVVAYNLTGTSSSSSVVSVNTLALPPTNISVSNVTSTGFTISWTESSGTITGYKIYQTIPYSVVRSTSSTSITISGLSPLTTYSFYITAYNSTSESVGSSAFTVTTIIDPPTNIIASNITSSGCKLSWTTASGSVTGYKVYQTSPYGILKGSTTGTSLTISDLQPCITYAFCVTSYSSTSESTKSAVVSVLTSSVIPTIPTNLSCTKKTAVSCNLSWTCTDACAKGYKIYQNGVFLKSVTVNSASITSLSKATSYTFSVSAYSSAGESSTCSSLSITTPNVSSPTNLAASNVTSTDCNLTWTAPSGSVDGYYIYQYFPYCAPVTTTTSTTASFNHLVSGLSNYQYYVTAYNTQGESGASNIISVSPSSTKSFVFADTVLSEYDNVIIFPNPSSSIINVRGIENFDVYVFDMSGKKCLDLKNVMSFFDISSLSDGTYIISLIKENTKVTKKVIKRSNY